MEENKEEEIKEQSQVSESKQENVVDYTDNYISALKDIETNSVDRKKYEEVLEANKKLAKALVNGEKAEQAEVKEKVDINKLREDIFTKESSNLEYITNVLKLRNALIENGEMDPFLPSGKNIVPTEEDIVCANRVAQKLQDCVDYADGNSDIFTSELQRIMVDTQPVQNKRR